MKHNYKFSSKGKGKKDKIKQKEQFPKLLLKVVETSDIILEILDARFISETRNLEIEELIKKKNKKIIYVLNKSDLISRINESEINEIKPYVVISCAKRKGGKGLRNRIKQEAKRVKKETPHYERIQIGVIGYPNTGKSSVINLLIGRNSAKTGAEAGFTKGLQKLKLTSDILLLDSPGVIPLKEYSSIDQKALSKHAKVSARDYNKIKEPEVVVSNLMKEYKKSFQEFYKTKTEDAEQLIEEVGTKRSILKKHGEVEADKTARSIIKDWQENKIKIYAEE